MAGTPIDRIPLHVTILPALGIAAWLVVGKVGLEFLRWCWRRCCSAM
jgi:hypothetical protein